MYLVSFKDPGSCWQSVVSAAFMALDPRSTLGSWATDSHAFCWTRSPLSLPLWWDSTDPRGKVCNVYVSGNTWPKPLPFRVADTVDKWWKPGRCLTCRHKGLKMISPSGLLLPRKRNGEPWMIVSPDLSVWKGVKNSYQELVEDCDFC